MALGIGCLVTLLSGCAPNDQQRSRSLQRLQLSTAEQSRVVQEVLERTIVQSWPKQSAGKPWRGSRPSAFSNTAVILSDDGYILTAAHCIRGDDAAYQFPQQSGYRGRVHFGGIGRLVWVGDAADVHRDLAIFKIDLGKLEGLLPSSLRKFEWSSHVHPGTVVIFAGLATGEHTQLTAAAGEVRHVDHGEGATQATTVIEIDGPIWKGDSGGPVTTLDGKLIGILSRVNILTGRTAAVRPNPEWVAEVIRNDRVGHPTTHPSLSSPL